MKGGEGAEGLEEVAEGAALGEILFAGDDEVGEEAGDGVEI